MQWFAELFKRSAELSRSPAPIFFVNTLGGKKDVFVPLKEGVASMYSCGPTVYGPQHIGNMRAALFSDSVARMLLEAGYHVRRVTNITDVGHLVGDGDHGEDKMDKGARELGASPREIADRYTKQYLDDCRALNIDTDDILFPRATEYIEEQIAMIKSLEEKGYAYPAEDGMYFDTKRFPNYGRLGGVNLGGLLPGSRIEKIPGKRSAHDFVLWRRAGKEDLQQWDSPWGKGNPGWHIECSAMIRAILGVSIDIHTGGMDHIPVHHNNEIAQSECANGKPLARYWLHEAFITIEGEKISKSLKNEVLVSDIVAKGYHPLALRYLFLGAHYRTPISFTWESLAAAHEALRRLWRIAGDIRETSGSKAYDSDARERVIALVRDDLATPAALALLWNTLQDEEHTPEEKWGMLQTADALFGLSLTAPPDDGSLTLSDLPGDIQKLIEERDLARGAKEWARADQIRDELTTRGYRVDDSSEGTLLTKKRG